MLDKSVPYVGFFMRKKAGAQIPSFPLPEGYRFAFYQDGDEAHWAAIETSVLEFDSEFAALMHFKESFLENRSELHRRCLFIEDSEGQKVATGTAWWSYVGYERRPWLHWIGVLPSHQGLGLGKAIVAKVTELMAQLEGGADIFLKTQTWSYKAVGIYLACGYEPTDEKILYRGRKYNYRKAMKILNRLRRKS
ncbi:MAG: GNAT family N-acetyltransferase [Oscillospiraceae bacterium]|nr:GNAT family N-acetyltransferase [Oscillospiraceae bacterium]